MMGNCGFGIGTCGSFLMDNDIEGLDNVVRVRNGNGGQLRGWDRHLW